MKQKWNVQIKRGVRKDFVRVQSEVTGNKKNNVLFFSFTLVATLAWRRRWPHLGSSRSPEWGRSPAYSRERGGASWLHFWRRAWRTTCSTSTRQRFFSFFFLFSTLRANHFPFPQGWGIALRSLSLRFLLADVRFCLHRGHCNEVVGDVALFASGERLGVEPLWIVPGCEMTQKRCWVYIFLMLCSCFTYTGLSDSAMTLSPTGTEGPAMQITNGSGWGKCVFLCVSRRDSKEKTCP